MINSPPLPNDRLWLRQKEVQHITHSATAKASDHPSIHATSLTRTSTTTGHSVLPSSRSPWRRIKRQTNITFVVHVSSRPPLLLHHLQQLSTRGAQQSLGGEKKLENKFISFALHDPLVPISIPARRGVIVVRLSNERSFVHSTYSCKFHPRQRRLSAHLFLVSAAAKYVATIISLTYLNNYSPVAQIPPSRPSPLISFSYAHRQSVLLAYMAVIR